MPLHPLLRCQRPLRDYRLRQVGIDLLWQHLAQQRQERGRALPRLLHRVTNVSIGIQSPLCLNLGAISRV